MKDQQKKSRKERRAEAERLVYEIDQIRSEVNRHSRKHLNSYRVVDFPNNRRMSIAVGVFLFSLTMLTISPIVSDLPDIWLAVICMSILMLITSGFTIVYEVNSWTSNEEDPTEIGYRLQDIECLRAKLDEGKKQLEENREKRRQLEPIMAKYLRLQPIVEDELQGEFTLDAERQVPHLRVKVQGKQFVCDTTEDEYADLVIFLAEAQKTQRIVREFEQRLDVLDAK